MKIFGLIEKFKSLVGVRQSSAPTPGTNEAAFYINTNGDPGFVKDASDVETVSHLPTSTQKLAFTTASASDAAVTIPNSGTLPNTTEASALAAGLISTHNNKTGVHDVGSGDIVGTDKVQELTNKKITGGTADATHKWTPPKETTTNLDDLTSRTEGEIAFDSTTKQLKTYNGTSWVAGSGDVAGPASSVDNSIARFDGIGGKTLQGYTADTPTASDTGVLTLPKTSSQLVLGATNTVTISGVAPAASRVYSIQDAGGNADFVMTAGAQTIAGVKTFNDGIKVDEVAGQSTLNSYIEYAEGDLDTITPTAGTWATIDSAKFKATRIGNKVTFWFRIESTTAASNLSSFEMRLPGIVDSPAYFSTTANGEIGFYGNGAAAEAVNGAARVPITIGIEKSATIQLIQVYFTAAQATKLVIGTIEYTC
jgi:hypothetical protein